MISKAPKYWTLWMASAPSHTSKYTMTLRSPHQNRMAVSLILYIDHNVCNMCCSLHFSVSTALFCVSCFHWLNLPCNVRLTVKIRYNTLWMSNNEKKWDNLRLEEGEGKVIIFWKEKNKFPHLYLHSIRYMSSYYIMYVHSKYVRERHVLHQLIPLYWSKVSLNKLNTKKSRECTFFSRPEARKIVKYRMKPVCCIINTWVMTEKLEHAPSKTKLVNKYIEHTMTFSSFVKRVRTLNELGVARKDSRNRGMIWCK